MHWRTVDIRRTWPGWRPLPRKQQPRDRCRRLGTGGAWGWQTESEIVAAEAPKQFSWSILNRSGELQESVWSYFVEPAEGGSTLRHHYRMGKPTEGITEIMSHLDEEGKQRFVREWGDKLRADMQATVDAIARITQEAGVPQ